MKLLQFETHSRPDCGHFVSKIQKDIYDREIAMMFKTNIIANDEWVGAEWAANRGRVRQYDAKSAGRWMTKDPIRFASSDVNLYG